MVNDLVSTREALRRLVHSAKRSRGTHLDPAVAAAMIFEAGAVAETTLVELEKCEAQVVAMGILLQGAANVSRETREAAKQGLRASSRIMDVFRNARIVVFWAEQVRAVFGEKDRAKWAVVVAALKGFDKAKADYDGLIAGEEKRMNPEGKTEPDADA